MEIKGTKDSWMKFKSYLCMRHIGQIIFCFLRQRYFLQYGHLRGIWEVVHIMKILAIFYSVIF